MIHALISVSLVAGQKGNISSPKYYTANSTMQQPTPNNCSNTYFELRLS